MCVFNRSFCLCGENGLWGGPSRIRGSAGRLVWGSRQERRGPETRVIQPVKVEKRARVRGMSGGSCSNRHSGGEDAGRTAPVPQH